MKVCSIVLKKGWYYTPKLQARLKKIIDKEKIDLFRLPARLRSLSFCYALCALREMYGYTYKISFIDMKLSKNEPLRIRKLDDSNDVAMTVDTDDVKLWLIDHCHVLITNHFLWSYHGYEARRLKRKGSIRFYRISHRKIHRFRPVKEKKEIVGQPYFL